MGRVVPSHAMNPRPENFVFHLMIWLRLEDSWVSCSLTSTNTPHFSLGRFGTHPRPLSLPKAFGIRKEGRCFRIHFALRTSYIVLRKAIDESRIYRTAMDDLILEFRNLLVIQFCKSGLFIVRGFNPGNNL